MEIWIDQDLRTTLMAWNMSGLEQPFLSKKIDHTFNVLTHTGRHLKT